MSYWVHECGNRNNSLWRYYQCDYLSDIKKLPTATKDGEQQEHDTVSKNKCSPGSQCLCHEDSSFWMLGKDTNKWIKRKITSSSGGSSGEIPDNIEPIPSDSIQSLFQ